MDKESKKTTIQIKNPGLKAFFYQQIHELKDFTLPDSTVELRVEKEDTKEFGKQERDFFVTLILTGGETFVKSWGKSKNIFKAISKAKEEMLYHLQSIQREIFEKSDDERCLSFPQSGYIH